MSASQINLKAVLFDLDDTLFDRDKAQLEMIATIMQKYQQLFEGVDEESIVKAFIESDKKATTEFDQGANIDDVRVGRSVRFLNALGLSTAPAEEMTAFYLDAYPTLNVPMKGVDSVIKDLAVRFQLGIVTNGSPDHQYQKLNTLNIKRFFECVVISEDVGIRKPDPEIFWKATSLLGREPEECLYVGDLLETDMLGAKRARIQACWLNARGKRPSKDDVKPD
ncbi:MAG: HAD family hydrolase, partial [Thermoplasmata archaeon]|nr:HAD family hydrolase [Thermoplasmata archaeon]